MQACLEAAVAGRLKMLFVTPECLAMTWVQERLRSVRVSLVCIDEAHYASETSACCRPGCLRIPQHLALVAPDAVKYVLVARQLCHVASQVALAFVPAVLLGSPCYTGPSGRSHNLRIGTASMRHSLQAAAGCVQDCVDGNSSC